MKRHLKYLILIFITMFGFALVSCEDDENESKNEQVLIRGYWICESKGLALEIISLNDYDLMKGFELTGDQPYDNVYQLWDIGGSTPQCLVSWTTQVGYLLFHNSDYSWRDKVYPSLSGDTNTLFLDGLDYYAFTRTTKDNFNKLVNRTTDNVGDSGNIPGDNVDEQDIVTMELLCRNNGFWIYDHSYSYVLSGNTQYAKHSDYVTFTKNNTIKIHLEWQCQGKSNFSGVIETRKSVVDAWGQYEIQGTYLLCEFYYVDCYGNSDLETKYWDNGVTNIKKYKISYDGDLVMIFGDENHRFNQDEIIGESGNSGSSNHHYPCKSCGESGDCWNCFGSGKDPITNKTCNTCHGSGKCQICNGKGYFII